MLVAPSGLTVHADVYIATLGARLISPRLREPDTVSNATTRGSQSNHPAPVVLNSPHLTSTQTGEQHSGDIRKPSRISNCKRCKFGTNCTSYIPPPYEKNWLIGNSYHAASNHQNHISDVIDRTLVMAIDTSSYHSTEQSNPSIHIEISFDQSYREITFLSQPGAPSFGLHPAEQKLMQHRIRSLPYS